MNEMIDKAYERAKRVLESCSTKQGFFASAGKKGYNAIWARDSVITSLGAILLPEFREVLKRSLVTLSKYQSKNGQIPNCIDKYSDRKPHIDYLSIDSSLWYVIGNYVYRKYDNKFFKSNKSSIERALNWLNCQDTGEDNMLVQLPTTDWQDAFPHKYGHTINTQALYYKVLNLVGRKRDAEKLKRLVNNDEEKGLWNGDYYLAYRWKNHGKYRELGDWFDSLGNLLAIIFDLADNEKAGKILAYIRKKKINLPYPVVAIYPPIKKGSEYWRDYYLDCDAGKAFHYANAGIWGFVGGFYILSLIKLKKFNEAKRELEKLAELNLRGNFPEWTNPKTKEYFGKLQAWEAGMYILSYESLKRRRILI